MVLGDSAGGDAIRKRMKDDNYVFILGRNISLSGSFTDPLTISLTVGDKYNGETVAVLYAKHRMVRWRPTP